MTTVRIPKQQRGIQAKQAVLDAAMELFAEKGFFGTNTKEIAARAGVSVGTFYSYYPDKEQLYVDALQSYQMRFTDLLGSVLAEMDFAQSDKRSMLRTLVERFIVIESETKRLHDEVVALCMSDPKFRDLSRKKNATSRAIICELFERFASEIHVVDYRGMAVVCFDMVNAVIDSITSKKTDVDAESIISNLVETLYKALFVAG